METLSELVKLITQKRVKKVELFDEENRTKNSHYFKLFEGIHHKKYATDQDASQDIYACDASEKKYLILKTRLKQKLLNTLFFVETNANECVTEQDVARYECKKNLYQINLLFLQKTHHTALSLLEKTRKKAQYHQLTDIELETSMLQTQFFAEAQQAKEYQQNAQYVLTLLEQYQKEVQARLWLEELEIFYVKNKIENKQLLQSLEQSIPQTQTFLEKYQTFALYDIAYRLLILKNEVEHDFTKTLKNISLLEKNYQQHPHFFSLEKNFDLQLRKLKTFVQMKDFEQGKKYMDILQNNFKQEEYAVSYKQATQFFHLSLLLAMHTGQYNYAMEHLEKIAHLPFFKFLDEKQRHIYTIFAMNLKFLAKNQKNTVLKNLSIPPKIDLKTDDFLQKEVNFDKSQRGVNIAHYTIKLLFLLKNNAWEDCNNVIDQLMEYTRRYPKPDANYRTECFIMMLKSMQDAEFKYYNTKKNADKFFQLLQQTPIEHRNYQKNIEILPFELVWDMMLDYLVKK